MVDGPGIRTVVFLSGCPLRCLYCHNPDTWHLKSGTKYTADQVIREVAKYKNFYRHGGGVTISGGEPFMQPEFLTAILKGCRERGIHTAVDTSGYSCLTAADNALQYISLLMLDIKSFNPKTYKEITGVELNRTLDMLRMARALHLPTWIRYVLVPGLTDNEDEIRALATYLQDFPNVKKIEILPFHKHGAFKWEEQGRTFPLQDTPEPSAKALQSARDILLQVHRNQIFYDDFYQ